MKTFHFSKWGLMVLLACILMVHVNCPGDGAKFDLSGLFSENPTGGGGGSGDDDDDTGDDDTGDDDTTGGGDDAPAGDDDDSTADPSEDECNPIATYYADADGDGYGNPTGSTLAVTSCTTAGTLSGYVNDATDCDDSNSGISPSTAEILGNGIDEDCNEDVYLGVYEAENDSDNDGDTDSIQRYYFKSNGYESGHLYDSAPVEPANADGWFIFEYTDNQVSAKYIMANGESTPTYSMQTFSGYDDAGNWAADSTYNSCNVETSPWVCSLSFENSYTYTYNENGDVSKLEKVYTRSSISSPEIEYYEYTYAESGQIETVKTYEDSDGDDVGDTLKTETTYTYDANGNILTKSTDSDGDGVVDVEYSMTWQSLSPSYEMTLPAQAFVLVKKDFAKTTETVTTASKTFTIHYTYDEHGVVESSFTDTDGDGDADEDVITTERTYLDND